MPLERNLTSYIWNGTFITTASKWGIFIKLIYASLNLWGKDLCIDQMRFKSFLFRTFLTPYQPAYLAFIQSCHKHAAKPSNIKKIVGGVPIPYIIHLEINSFRIFTPMHCLFWRKVAQTKCSVLESDENSESWQKNQIAVSCSSFDLQTSLFNKRCLFCWKNTLWISRNGCRSKDEQDSVFLSQYLLVRFSCHDSEFSSGSGSKWLNSFETDTWVCAF